MTPPTALERIEAVLQRGRRRARWQRERQTTMVEWPSEKNKPTATGRLPSCISLRVTLSMAAM